MSASKQLIDLLKSFEGLRLTAYQCSAGVWTVGWGTTRYPNGSVVKPGDVISNAFAEECLANDLKKFTAAVFAFVSNKLNQNQFDALVDFCYNLGENALKKSTLLQKVNTNSADPSIEAEFMKWVFVNGRKSAGLARRRQAEVYLYFS